MKIHELSRPVWSVPFFLYGVPGKYTFSFGQCTVLQLLFFKQYCVQCTGTPSLYLIFFLIFLTNKRTNQGRVFASTLWIRFCSWIVTNFLFRSESGCWFRRELWKHRNTYRYLYLSTLAHIQVVFLTKHPLHIKSPMQNVYTYNVSLTKRRLQRKRLQGLFKLG
jgi:hypothetical protein